MHFITYLKVFSIIFFTNIECRFKFEIELNDEDERLNIYMKRVITGFFVEYNRRLHVKVIEGRNEWFSVMNMGEFDFRLSNVDSIKQIPVPPKKGTRGVSTYDPEEAFIYFCKDLLDCSLSTLEAINPTAKIMLIAKEFDETLAEGMFVQAWKNHKLLNVILVDITNEVYYLYNPFIQEVTIYHISTVIDFVAFKKNRLKNLHKYTIRANVFATPLFCKIDKNLKFGWMCAEFLDSLEKVMNLTTKYIAPLTGSNYGAIVNGQFIGALKEIEDDRVDVSATLRGFGFWFNATQLTMMAPVTDLKLCYAVPNDFYPPKIKIFHFEFFDGLTCVFIGVTLISILLSTYVISYFAHDTAPLDVVKFLFVLLAVATSITVFNPPKQQMIRIMFGIALLAFLIINASYQSLIITALNMNKPSDLKTQDELVQHNFTIYLPLNIERLIQAVKFLPPDNAARKLFDKAIRTPVENRPEVKKVAETRAAAACIPDFYFGNYQTDYLNNKTGESAIHMLADCPYVFYLSMSIPRNSPYMENFNRILLMIVETGLKKHQYDVAIAELSLSYIRAAKSGLVQEETLKLISMDELWILFVYYGIAISGTIVAFCLEQIYYFVVTRKKVFSRIKACLVNRYRKNKM